jgi:valyl-tRNA synthetase
MSNAFVRIKAGAYRTTDVSGRVFQLVDQFRSGAKGGYVTVKNGGQFPGFPEDIRVKVNSMSDFEFVTEVIAGVRTIRKEKNIPFKDTIELKVVNNEKATNYFDSIITKLGNISKLSYTTEKVEGALTYRVKSNEYFIPISGSIDVAAEIEKLQEELKYTQGFLKSVQVKLSNEKFVTNAKPEIIANERNKEADAFAKIAMIEQSLAGLK